MGRKKFPLCFVGFTLMLCQIIIPEPLPDKDFLMGKFEKRLCALALVFVAVYLAAAVVTLQSRMSAKTETIQRLESEQVSPAEGRLLLVQLFLPMAILFTLTISYIVVRKTRAKKALSLDEPDDDLPRK